MRRIRRRKVLYGSILSLIFLMSFSLSCFISNADLLITDASLVFSEVPTSEKGFIRYIPTISSNHFDSTGFSYTMQASTASYAWRNNWYFDQTVQPTLSPHGAHSIIMWKYSSALTFDVNFIYEFRINVRMQSSDFVANASSNFSKILLCFGDTDVYFNASTIHPTNVVNHFRGFEPSSYTWNSSYGVCELVYRVPIFPETLFPDLTVQDNGTGTKFVSIPCMAIEDMGSGAISFIQDSSSGIWRYSGSFFPRTTSSVKLYTAEEWQSHVVEQGFSDLSAQIDLSTGQIINQLQEGVDQILDLGDDYAVDFHEWDMAHEASSDFVHGVTSTLPYDGSSVSGLLAGKDRLTALSAAFSDLGDWYQYVYDNNEFVFFAVWIVLACAMGFMTFKVFH